MSDQSIQGTSEPVVDTSTAAPVEPTETVSEAITADLPITDQQLYRN